MGNFCPETIEIKGWLDYDQRAGQGLTKPEVLDYLAKLKEVLEPKYAELIDMVKTETKNRYILNYKVILVLKEPGEPCWLLKEGLDALWKKEDKLFINGRRPTAVVESPPWKKPGLQAADKMLQGQRV